MESNSVTTFAHPVRTIVSSGKEFPGGLWREAILHYLFSIWASKDRMSSERRISFDDVTLGLTECDTQPIGTESSRLFYAFGCGRDSGKVPPGSIKGNMILAGNSEERVEVALAQFVKNADVRCVSITTGTHRGLLLWKTDVRREIGCSGVNLPEVWEGSI